MKEGKCTSYSNKNRSGTKPEFLHNVGKQIQLKTSNTKRVALPRFKWKKNNHKELISLRIFSYLNRFLIQIISFKS